MKAQPTVTALIDTYNQERFIAEAIDSVLAQDFPASEMEILVVDDGSTDGTPEIVRRYADRVRYIRKENGGQASALNLGFAEAQGEIVAMLDGDDVWLPQKISRTVAEFERCADAVVVYHPYVYWDPERGLAETDSTFYAVNGRMPFDVGALLRYGGYGTCSMALRRAVCAAILPIPESLRLFADAYIVYLAPFLGHVVGVSEPLTLYRQHGSNLTAFEGEDHERSLERWKRSAAAAEESKAWLVRHGHDLGEPTLSAYLKRHELVSRMQRFRWRTPGRVEYFRYLRECHSLYRPLWPLRYRFFRSALTLAGLALGYQGFEALRGSYARKEFLLRLRKSAIPGSKKHDVEHRVGDETTA
jgi:glycosyltransferase involved in cell wall biosynthesis